MAKEDKIVSLVRGLIYVLAFAFVTPAHNNLARKVSVNVQQQRLVVGLHELGGKRNFVVG